MNNICTFHIFYKASIIHLYLNYITNISISIHQDPKLNSPLGLNCYPFQRYFKSSELRCFHVYIFLKIARISIENGVALCTIIIVWIPSRVISRCNPIDRKSTHFVTPGNRKAIALYTYRLVVK